MPEDGKIRTRTGRTEKEHGARYCTLHRVEKSVICIAMELHLSPKMTWFTSHYLWSHWQHTSWAWQANLFCIPGICGLPLLDLLSLHLLKAISLFSFWWTFNCGTYLLDRSFHDVPSDNDLLWLPETYSPSDRLVLYTGIPLQLNNENTICSCEIKSRTTRD